MKKKALIIRFSSFGDVVQCMTVVNTLKLNGFSIDWLTRQDMAAILKVNPNVENVYSLDKKKSLGGLIKLGLMLRKNNYTHVYDAHNNTRSIIVSWIICLFAFKKIIFVRRKKFRLKRWLLIRFKLKSLPQPLVAAKTYLQPILHWLGKKTTPQGGPLNLPSGQPPFDNYICIAPSAAWPLKRWPLEHWVQLIKILEDQNFVILGGPEDTFCGQIQANFNNRVVNLAGQLNWLESASVVQSADLVIGNDTGMTHLADYLGKPNIIMMGAATFCFPFMPTTKALWLDLDCQPCSKDGRGKCVNPVYLQCLLDIKPSVVAEHAKKKLVKL